MADANDDICDPGKVDVNNSDMIVFVARECGTNIESLYRYRNGVLEKLIEGGFGLGDIVRFDEISINEAGQVAFTGLLFAFDTVNAERALMFWDVDQLHVVLKETDLLDGDPVSSLIKLHRSGFNDKGEVAFAVVLDAPGATSFPRYVIAAAAPVYRATAGGGGGGGGSLAFLDLLILVCLSAGMFLRTRPYQGSSFFGHGRMTAFGRKRTLSSI